MRFLRPPRPPTRGFAAILGLPGGTDCAGPPVVDDFPGWLRRWRRRPPPAASFITWRLARGQPPLQPRERQVVFQAVLGGHGTRYEVAALVVMDDHVHVLLRGPAGTARRLSRSWKAISSHHLQRIHRRPPSVWADGEEVQAVEGEESLRARADRILGNPWKRWPFLQGYPWVYHGIED